MNTNKLDATFDRFESHYVESTKEHFRQTTDALEVQALSTAIKAQVQSASRGNKTFSDDDVQHLESLIADAYTATLKDQIERDNAAGYKLTEADKLQNIFHAALRFNLKSRAAIATSDTFVGKSENGIVTLTKEQTKSDAQAIVQSVIYEKLRGLVAKRRADLDKFVNEIVILSEVNSTKVETPASSN